MNVPHGPHRISQNGQVVVPKDVLKAADLESGDAVFLVAQDDPPGTILVIPVEVAASWFEKGRALDRTEGLAEGQERRSPG